MSARSRSPWRSPVCWVAAAGALILHLAGSWWLQSGRSGASGAFHRVGHVTQSNREGGSIHLTLTSARTIVAGSHGPVRDVMAQQGSASTEHAHLQASPEDAELASPAAGRTVLSSRYVGAEQLDHSPEPQPGWILNESAFPVGQSARLLVRVWVSDEGVIDQIALVHAEPAGEWSKRAIQPMQETPMSAPLMGGRAVSAVIMVELTAEDEGFR